MFVKAKPYNCRCPHLSINVGPKLLKALCRIPFTMSPNRTMQPQGKVAVCMKKA